MSRQTQFYDLVGTRVFDTLQRKLATWSDARAERLGERIMMLAYRADKKHRRRTHANLALAYPEWSEAEVDATAKGVWRHFGRMMADFVRTPVRARDDLLATMEVVGIEHLEEAERLEKGVVIITAHLGNWERLGAWLVASGRKLTVVARDANQSGVNDRIAATREAAGVAVLSRGNAARAILNTLKRNEMVGILPDQNAGDAFIPFFGKPCGTVAGPAVIHVRSGAPLVPVFAFRTGPGRYRVECHRAIVAEPGFEPREGLMRSMNAAIEAAIRSRPDQWNWMHDRWKSARREGLL